jgi:outer membrane protein TolC
MRNLLLCLWVFLALDRLLAQQPPPELTARQAVEIALLANYDIQLAQDEAEIARLNNTRANAGMLPVVNAVANENFTLSTFQQKLANGNEFSELGAPFNNFNAGLQLSWTLFDGRRMQMTKRRLEAQEDLGRASLRNAVQATCGAVLLGYYDIVRGGLQERALAEVIVLNEERLRIAEARLAAGFAAQTDVLQARIDLNQRRADLLNQQTATRAAKRNLNRLLARQPDLAFEVEQALESNLNIERNRLIERIMASNPTLNVLQKNAEVAALSVEEARRLNRPRITGLSQLNAQRTDNGAGFLLNNTQAGLTIGANLVLPIYTGGNLRRQRETAQLVANQANTRTNAQRLAVEAELDNLITFYATQRDILQLEEENVRVARENFQVSTERFRLGVTNGLEPQTAQNTLEQALARRNLVLFNLKSTEVQLRLLAGEL